jgi:para-nitrobenzyl esterase
MKKQYVVLALLIQFASSLFAQAPQVKVEQGTLEGTMLASGIMSFKGVPFAQPPVGDFRWKAPQAPKKWSGVRKADAFGNYAMQKQVYGDMHFRAATMSEDCLYLNVWTPAKQPAEKLPVLVYFYGGGFVCGDGSENRYDGESLAEKGIVTVTVNYRLGVFGFLAHPDLTKESPNKASGNYGLLDQNAALVWVKKNIAAFGGDPNKITIAGESAGSISVSAHMVSPLSKKLIAGAIGQSGAMISPTLAAIPLAEAEKNGQAFSQTIKAGSLAALRAMPAAQLLEEASKWGAFSAKTVVDGYFLPKNPIDMFKEGEQAQVPLLTGWTSAEIPYMAILQGEYPSVENYRKKVMLAYGDSAEEVLKLYPAEGEKEAIVAATALASDGFIVYSTWKWADMHRQTTKQPVYVYTFSRKRPLSKSETENAEMSKMPKPMQGASHASDIEYMLGNLDRDIYHVWEPEDQKVSMLAESYFANFIKTGNPNAAQLPEWTANGPDGSMNIMNIDVEARTQQEQHRDRYLFLDRYFSSKK